MDHAGRKLLCVALGIGLAISALYLHFRAPLWIKMGVEAVQLDKLLHIIGGIFLVMLMEWQKKTRSFWEVFGVVVMLTLFWKAAELSADSSAYRFILAHLHSWILDLIGDFAATVLGALLYWRIAIWPTLEK